MLYMRPNLEHAAHKVVTHVQVVLYYEYQASFEDVIGDNAGDPSFWHRGRRRRRILRVPELYRQYVTTLEYAVPLRATSKCNDAKINHGRPSLACARIVAHARGLCASAYRRHTGTGLPGGRSYRCSRRSVCSQPQLRKGLVMSMLHKIVERTRADLVEIKAARPAQQLLDKINQR
eukprot:6177665-Pleurochrysis_carterae.AAC.1